MKLLYSIIAFCLLISYTTFSQSISSNAPLCGNANLTLELTATGGTTYAWKGPNSFTSTQQKPNIKNVNYRNRGVYTVTIDNKTTLTTDVNIKDPVAFTVPKEILIGRASTLLIEPKNSRLTDSTEVPSSYSFITPKGVEMSGNIVPVVLEGETGTYKVIGNAGSSGCSVTQNVKVSLSNKILSDRRIEMVSLSNIKICFGQDYAIPFYPQPASYFKEGTKYKVYLIKRGELLSTSRQPDAIVEKSPVILKGINDNVGINSYERVLIVADDAEQTKGISDYRQFPNSQYLTSYYNSYVRTTSIVCDSAKLSANDGNNINSIQWFQDGIAINGANSKDFLVKNSGTYTYKFKGNKEPYEIDKNCLYESRPEKIELRKIEKPYVQDTSRFELCVGKPTALFVYFPKNNTTYRWKKNGSFISNATNTFLPNLQEGEYQVEAKQGTCTVLSDTIKVKKPANLNEIYYFGLKSLSPIQTYDNQLYTLCNNQKFNFESGQVPFAKRQLFKNGVLIYEAPNRYELSTYSLQEEGTYFIKAVYGDCESFSKPITVRYSNTLRGETYLRNNNLDLCEGSSAYFKLSFNGSKNYKLGDGFVYKDGNVIRNWFKYQDSNVNYYIDAEPNSESGSYYAVGKAIFPDKSECLIKTDTVKIKFSKRVFQDVSDIDYPSQTNLITIGTCKDTTELRSYNNIGSYNRQTSYKWIKDGIVLKQDSSSILKANQAGTYQLETTYKGGCTIVSVPYKVEFGKIKVDLYSFDKLVICDGDFYQVYPNFSEYSDKNVYSIFKDEKLFKENALLIPSAAFYGYFDLSQSGTYKITVKNGKCEGTSPDFTLKVDKIPTTITPSDSVTFCDGKTVELKTSTEAGLSYIWERNGSVISQANQANYTANADGLYKATLLRGACWGTTPSVKLKTLANILPVATLTGDKKIDYDTETKLSINLTSHAPWTFKLSDGKEYTATKSPFEVSVKPLSTTAYSVTEVKNICGTGTVSGSAKIEIIILSAEEEKELNVEVFPMPSSEICHWKIETPQATKASVLMYDALGITQYTHTSATRTPSHEGTIDLSTLKAGTYFLKLQAGEKSVVRKVVKF